MKERKVGGRSEGRAGEGGREKMNLFPPPPKFSSNELTLLLDDMLFGKPYPLLFVFLSSPWLELLCGYQDQSLFFFFAVAFYQVMLHAHFQLFLL